MRYIYPVLTLLLALGHLPAARADVHPKGTFTRPPGVPLEVLLASPEHHLAPSAVVKHEVRLHGRAPRGSRLVLVCSYAHLTRNDLSLRTVFEDVVTLGMERTVKYTVPVAADGSYRCAINTFLAGRFGTRYRLQTAYLDVQGIQNVYAEAVLFNLYDWSCPWLAEALLRFPTVDKVRAIVLRRTPKDALSEYEQGLLAPKEEYHASSLRAAGAAREIFESVIRLPCVDGVTDAAIDIEVIPAAASPR